MIAPPPIRCLSLLVAVLLTGCTTVEHSFDGEDPGRVWTALVAVALAPDYSEPDEEKRWRLKENEVWVQPAEGRIEIYRELTRTTKLSSVKPHTAHKTWRFQILLAGETEPVATFKSRGTGVPKEAGLEAQRYFNDAWALLRPPLIAQLPPPIDGAVSPRDAVRQLLRGLFMRDEDMIRNVTLPHIDAAVLWDGPRLEWLPLDAQLQLRRQVIRTVQPGDEIVLDGELVLVTPEMVTDERKILLASVGGQELAPITVLRVGSGWRVDATPIIERQLEVQRAREQQ